MSNLDPQSNRPPSELERGIQTPFGKVVLGVGGCAFLGCAVPLVLLFVLLLISLIGGIFSG
jgi:hypothetical protein